MANITITTPNTSKTYSLTAGETSDLMAFATAVMDGGLTATQIEKEQWLARELYAGLLRRASGWKRRKLRQDAVAGYTDIPVVEA